MRKFMIDKALSFGVNYLDMDSIFRDDYKINNKISLKYICSIPTIENNEFKDPKSTLQELTQKKFKSLPVYSLKESSTSGEKKFFEVLCSIDETSLITHGKGNTRKGAELDAAQYMLKLIKQDV